MQLLKPSIDIKSANAIALVQVQMLFSSDQYNIFISASMTDNLSIYSAKSTCYTMHPKKQTQTREKIRSSFLQILQEDQSLPVELKNKYLAKLDQSGLHQIFEIMDQYCRQEDPRKGQNNQVAHVQQLQEGQNFLNMRKKELLQSSLNQGMSICQIDSIKQEKHLPDNQYVQFSIEGSAWTKKSSRSDPQKKEKVQAETSKQKKYGSTGDHAKFLNVSSPDKTLNTSQSVQPHPPAS